MRKGRAIRWVVGALAAVSAAAVAAACGLDEGETVAVLDGGPGSDVTVNDGGTVPDVVVDVADVFVPPTCATIDASCLGTAVPDGGWALLGVADGILACPSADFDPVALVENPRLAANACTCAACVPAGQYSCPSFTMKFGSSCGGPAITQQTTNPCVSHGETGGNAKVSTTPSPPLPSGVGCNSAATGSGQALTDPLSGCRPNKCSADFCGLNALGFRACIAHDNVLPCPNGFNLRGYAGGAGAASCAACGCNTLDVKCTGSVRVFAGGGPGGTCDGDGGLNGLDYKDTVGADGGCNDPGVNFDSVFYAADPPPQVACAPAAPTPGSGDAGLVSIKTICCP